MGTKVCRSVSEKENRAMDGLFGGQRKNKRRVMARATRSSAAILEKSDIPALPRASSKKRKRLSNTDNDDQPTSKLPRTDSQTDSLPAAQSRLLDNDATSILDILEVTDSQGLLDRVFPLPYDASSQGSFSLRELLKQPAQHPLWVLRAAVQNLFPLSSSHPRSLPSNTAIQQHRFCKVALSLLDQASRNVVSIPLSAFSILDIDRPATPGSPSTNDESPEPPKTAAYSSPPLAYKKYALVQHLPSGDYWSSLNADIHNSTKQLKDLSLAHAELVAVFPSPSQSNSSPSVPLIGSYHAHKVATSTSQSVGKRRVTSGTFLDYGPWSSFAPSFDHDGQTVGRSELGELLYHRAKKKGARDAETIAETEDEEAMICDPANGEVEHLEELDELLPPDIVESLKDALKCLELEKAVTELLERNRKALRRLQELQMMRLSGPDGGSSQVEEGSEEWETAHAILDSLSILASLRPTSTKSKVQSIIPPASVFQRLQRTLVKRPTEGWYGTLPPTKPTALRDDSTVKAGSIAAVTTVTATPTASTTTPAPTATYAGYTYAYGQQPYRPPATGTTYTPYKQSQYYQAPYLTTATQQLGAQNYYQQAYTGGATGQQPYAAYSAWYSQYSAPAANATPAATSGASSGRGTPQPTTSTAQSAQAAYGGYFAAAGTPPPATARSPAVANTVLTNKPGTPGATWTAYTPQVKNSQQPGYYGAYVSQTPTSAAR